MKSKMIRQLEAGGGRACVKNHGCICPGVGAVVKVGIVVGTGMSPCGGCAGILCGGCSENPWGVCAGAPCGGFGDIPWGECMGDVYGGCIMVPVGT